MLQDSLVIFQYIYNLLINNEELWLLIFPALISLELPLYLLIITGILRWSYRRKVIEIHQYPSVSVIITCYAEGNRIQTTIETLVEQIYPGYIEILIIVDGAIQNKETYQTAVYCKKKYQKISNKKISILPKWKRGGRVSTLNAGLSIAKGDIIINVDGDTSFDNDMIQNIIHEFRHKDVIASGGALRVRNQEQNILTKLQSLEYLLSMQAGKTGMAEWGVLNNISGAFGAFKKDILKQIGGWDTHTAEDLDLTVRLKQYKRRYPHNKLAYSTRAIGHTDVPDTLRGLVNQRLRWDGDLFFLYLRKHNKGLTPSLLGWGNFLFILMYGIIQNVIMPLLVVIFTLYIIISYPIKFIIAIMLIIYFSYLFLSLLTFIIYITLISERIKYDLKSIKWLFLYPIYQFCMRLITAISILNEIIRRSHEESNMAPWWVLKHGKRF
ncbi:glycosyltransferase family 2 protein [Photobacterium damselae subsp. damselae]|uniref:glycosyltransferase family 2 protein n=1 Tax=Photobacterium damselae TaxID=38293 RepID=UPI004068995F